jgi:hypothetical protein
MQIFDMTCPYCGTIYKGAISDTVRGLPDKFQCQICAEALDKWDEPKFRVYRIVSPTGEAYLHASTTPPPLV